MNKHAFVRRQGVRSSALMSVAALATTGLFAAAAPAGAAVTAGPDDGTTGLPAYLVDHQGIAVQLCLEACVEPAEPGGPPAEPANPNHAPYFSAEAAVGPFSVAYEISTDQEAEGDPAEVINAAGVRARGLAANATYIVKGPWGSFGVRSDDRGRIAEEKLNAVQGFLRPPVMSDGMLGDAHALTRVTGSPTGFNRVTVTGPGVNASTNRFALLGQLRDDTPMSSVNATSLKLGSITTATPSQGTVNVSSFGTADLSLSASLAGMNPGAFAVTNNGCMAAASGSACNITVSYTPRANRNVSAILTLDDPADLTPARQVTLRGVANDTRSPKVASSNPARGASSFRPGKTLKIRFSENVRGAKSGLMLVDASGDKVAARVSRVRRTSAYKLDPRGALNRDATYMVKVNGGRNGIQDLAGNAARDVQWRFRTR